MQHKHINVDPYFTVLTILTFGCLKGDLSGIAADKQNIWGGIVNWWWCYKTSAENPDT